jgi:hypothetical protein
MKVFTWSLLLGALALMSWGGSFAADETTERIQLFNGKDFQGWKLFLPDTSADPTLTWGVMDSVIHCTGNPAGYMRTTTPYENYTLYLEWRFPEGAGNSGVLLHASEPDEVWPKSIEAQLQSEDAGDFWVIGGTSFKEHTDVNNRRVVKKEASNEKPLGEWNQYKIVCKGDKIKVFVNGTLQNIATECTVTKGFIGLQSEGVPVEFRNIYIEPVKKKAEK